MSKLIKLLFIKDDKVVSVNDYNPKAGIEIACTVEGTTSLEVPSDTVVKSGDGILVSGGGFTIVPAPPAPPKVAPVTFKLLWTIQERIAITGMRTTDPVIGDIMSIVDNPRLEYVDLALESTSEGILYTLSKLAEGGIIAPEAIATRHAEIRTGAIS